MFQRNTLALGAVLVCVLSLSSSLTLAQPSAPDPPGKPLPAADFADGADPHAHEEIEAATGESAGEARLGFSKADGFHLRSEDGDYLLRISLQLGLKAEPAWNEGDKQVNSSFAFVRPILRGNFFRPWLTYRVSMELGRGVPFLLDAHLDIERWEEFNVRLGQQVTLVSRHAGMGPQQIFFPEWSGVSNYFWSGRERGVTVFGTVFNERLDYFAGVFSGSPLDGPVNLPDNYVVEARLTANPLGEVNANELPFGPDGETLPLRISFTAQGYHGKLETVDENYNLGNGILAPNATVNADKLSMAGADVWLQGGPLIMFGEFYWRHMDPVGALPAFTSYGAWGQAILKVYRDLVGVGTRVSWLNPDADTDDDQAYEAEGQVALFIEPPALVCKLRYAWLYQKVPDGASTESLPHAPGKTHVLTAQLNLAF